MSERGISTNISKLGDESIFAYYKLDNNTLDSIGNYHAINNGATIETDCHNKQCYSFDDTNDYMSIGTDSVFNLQSNFKVVGSRLNRHREWVIVQQ